MYTNLYRGCKWLIEQFKKHHYLSLRDINENWKADTDMSGGVEMLRKTFQRYKTALKESFGVEICCKEGGSYAYYIKNPEILHDIGLADWMLNTLAMDEKLRDCKSLRDRIVLEKIPSGGRKLDCITNAMLKDCKLKFNYRVYGSCEMNERIVEPYGLMLYHQRWYLLARFGGDKTYTFGLDRIKSPKVTSENFSIDPSFNAKDYFEEFYGLYNSGKDKVQIVLRAFKDEGYYLRDLPIHKSQKEIGCGDGYVDFMIEVRPNNELVGYILSRGDRLKVLSPPSFVEEIKMTLDRMRNNYM